MEGQRLCANACQCCLFFLIALGSQVGILCATLRSENKLWLGMDRLTVKGDWAEAAALTAGEGCSSSNPGSTCLSNQSGLVCMQIDSYTADHAQINDLLPDRTFTATNFSGDRHVDAWRFGNATVACMTCLADTGDPARKIRGSGCELECGLVCRGHFANGDNICTGEDYTREDLWIYGTVYGLNLLALILLPVLASMMPVSIIRWLLFRLSLPMSSLAFWFLILLGYFTLIKTIVFFSWSGMEAAYCINTGAWFWGSYLIIGFSMLTIGSAKGNMEMTLGKVKLYGELGAILAKGGDELQEEFGKKMGMMKRMMKVQTCCLACCYLPFVIWLCVTTGYYATDPEFGQGLGVGMTAGFAVAALVIYVGSKQNNKKLALLGKFMSQIAELSEREMNTSVSLPDAPLVMHYISKQAGSGAGVKSKKLLELCNDPRWQALVRDKGLADWHITQCPGDALPADLHLTSHMWSPPKDSSGEVVKGSRHAPCLKRLPVVGPDGVESTLQEFPADVLSRLNAVSDHKYWIDVLSHLDRVELVESTVPFMGTLYQSRVVDPIFLSYTKVDMEHAFKRGWVYQETANTQLNPERVKKFLHEHRGDRKILETFFVRRGANLPLVMQKLRKEKPMTEPELATIFAHLAYEGSHIEAMLQALTKVLARYCDESWFIEAIVAPTKHDCANPIQAFQLLNAYCSLDLTKQEDAPQAITLVAAKTAGEKDLKTTAEQAAFLQKNWLAVAVCGIPCSFGRKRFLMATGAKPDEKKLDAALVSAGLGELPEPHGLCGTKTKVQVSGRVLEVNISKNKMDIRDKGEDKKSNHTRPSD